MPRVSSDGGSLPNVRTLVSKLFGDTESPSHLATVLHMRFGQFLDHDMDRTAISKLATSLDGSTEPINVECGEDGCSTEGMENRNCFPIPIPTDDPDFGNSGKNCLMFVRSEQGVNDNCTMGKVV